MQILRYITLFLPIAIQVATEVERIVRQLKEEEAQRAQPNTNITRTAPISR